MGKGLREGSSVGMCVFEKHLYTTLVVVVVVVQMFFSCCSTMQRRTEVI